MGHTHQDNKVLNIKFIKIDVEGFEYRVLKGLTRIIKTQKPVIAIEQFPEEFAKARVKGKWNIKAIDERRGGMCFENTLLDKDIRKWYDSIM